MAVDGTGPWERRAHRRGLGRGDAVRSADRVAASVPPSRRRTLR